MGCDPPNPPDIGGGQVGKWGSGEVGKWGSCLITLSPQNPITLSPDDRRPTAKVILPFAEIGLLKGFLCLIFEPF
ncbi:MAG: hypothetical protein EWV76_19645 [Microcystis novacekii Mn_MB_F_20050700_S1]|uniref:Uncharacterized protein n=1 Tax=Microcystis novacekii Mn_MB_F_20050700_S1D TaxID=2486266 RepID=A0A552IRL5_9CHRO|nr:MAG: hypothetical protein EWV76_19645 [Microcystis novacekii Mn_MB_F_20050700_S1]TRU86128.1 MAG: hypothetical protein EWV54_14845 [Microcystis novacekii Mn_MB_F_20050700_S1D]